MRAGGLGGARREKTAVSAKAFFRFVGWFSHRRLTHTVLLVEKVRELFERCPLASVVPEDDQGDLFPLA